MASVTSESSLSRDAGQDFSYPADRVGSGSVGCPRTRSDGPRGARWGRWTCSVSQLLVGLDLSDAVHHTSNLVGARKAADLKGLS